jgi:flagellum-specific ATP synthase
MPKLVTTEHLKAARRLKTWIAKYERSRDMLAMGAYMPGSDPELDMAIKNWPAVLRLLQQDTHEVVNFETSRSVLLQLMKVHA